MSNHSASLIEVGGMGVPTIVMMAIMEWNVCSIPMESLFLRQKLGCGACCLAFLGYNPFSISNSPAFLSTLYPSNKFSFLINSLFFLNLSQFQVFASKYSDRDTGLSVTENG